MKTQLDMDKIARGLGAERKGKIKVSSGQFGAMQFAGGDPGPVPGVGAQRPSNRLGLDRATEWGRAFGRLIRCS